MLERWFGISKPRAGELLFTPVQPELAIIPVPGAIASKTSPLEREIETLPLISSAGKTVLSDNNALDSDHSKSMLRTSPRFVAKFGASHIDYHECISRRVESEIAKEGVSRDTAASGQQKPLSDSSASSTRGRSRRSKEP